MIDKQDTNEAFIASIQTLQYVRHRYQRLMTKKNGEPFSIADPTIIRIDSMIRHLTQLLMENQ